VRYHDLAVILGWVAVLVTLWGTIAQFQRALQRGIEGVSLATWTLFVLMGLFWITYGADRRSIIIIVGSLAVLPFQLAIVVKLKPWRRWPIVIRSILFSVVFCVLPGFAWGWPGAVYGTGFAMVINRAPQIIELIRYPDATGVSVAMWLLGATGSLCWVLYYQDARLWAPLISTAFAGLASLAIARLAKWRHRQVNASRLSPEVALYQA